MAGRPLTTSPPLPNAQPKPDDVDVVVVSYNSRDRLRKCISTVGAAEGVRVTVVDNASSDGSLETLHGLAVRAISLPANRGFAHGCNVGWHATEAPLVLFLNPDASIEPSSLRVLVDALTTEKNVAAAAPRMMGADGSLDFSLRRFTRLRTTFARALLLHRVFPHATWADQVVRDANVYDAPASPEWVSGACILIRRSALEEVGGFDERFFLYCEDEDLCRRLWRAGLAVRYFPDAVCTHEGGASSPRASLLPTMAASRIRYAQLHGSRGFALIERIGLALEAAVRLVASARGIEARRGHARALRVILGRSPDATALRMRTQLFETSTRAGSAEGPHH
jgi:GT2 family glycosyltransferase